MDGNTIQIIIVILIIVLALCFIVRRIACTLKSKDAPCGCGNCPQSSHCGKKPGESGCAESR